MKGQYIRGLIKFITDIRNLKTDDEKEYRIQEEIAKIRVNFSSPKLTEYDKKKNLLKLLYIQMLGYDIDLGYLESVQLMASNKLTDKATGYMGCEILLKDYEDVMRLCINTTIEDLNNPCEHISSLALTFIANSHSLEINERLSNEVIKLSMKFTSVGFYLRKKMYMCLLRTYKLNRHLYDINEWFNMVYHILQSETSVTCLLSICNLLDPILKEKPKNWELCVDRLVTFLWEIAKDEVPEEHIYFTIPTPWLTVKLLSMFSTMDPIPTLDSLPLFSNSLKILLDKTSNLVLTRFGNKESNRSKKLMNLSIYMTKTGILRETIRAVVNWFPYLHNIQPQFICNCIRHLYTSVMSQIRLVALEIIEDVIKIKETFEYIKIDAEFIIHFLNDSDPTIKKRCCLILCGLCDEKNWEFIVPELISTLRYSELSIQEYMVPLICNALNTNLPKNTLYIDLLFKIIEHAPLISNNIISTLLLNTLYNENIDFQEKVVSKCLDYLNDDTQMNEGLLRICAYVLGDYCDLSNEISMLEQLKMFDKYFIIATSETKCILITTFSKYASKDNNLIKYVENILEKNINSLDVNLQTRICELLKLLRTNFPLFNKILQLHVYIDNKNTKDNKDKIQQNIQKQLRENGNNTNKEDKYNRYSNSSSNRDSRRHSLKEYETSSDDNKDDEDSKFSYKESYSFEEIDNKSSEDDILDKNKEDKYNRYSNREIERSLRRESGSRSSNRTNKEYKSEKGSNRYDDKREIDDDNNTNNKDNREYYKDESFDDIQLNNNNNNRRYNKNNEDENYRMESTYGSGKYKEIIYGLFNNEPCKLLYTDELKVELEQAYKNQQSKLLIKLTNITNINIHLYKCNLKSPPELQGQEHNQLKDIIIKPNQCINHKLSFILLEEILELPKYNIEYGLETEKEIYKYILELPVTIHKFMVPLQLEPSSFTRLWNNLLKLPPFLIKFNQSLHVLANSLASLNFDVVKTGDNIYVSGTGVKSTDSTEFYCLGMFTSDNNKTIGTDEVQPTNTVVTYELKNLEEHGHVTHETHNHAVKRYVFDPTGQKTVNKVQYDGTVLWTTDSTQGKVFKKLEAFEKKNLLQLVDLTLKNETSEEHLYYKKVKGNFEKLSTVTEFNNLLENLKTRRDQYVDDGFPLDLHKKNLYTRFYNEKLEMVDGVWRKALTLANGKAYLARDGTQELWNVTTESKQLGTVKEFDFGDNNKLLEFTLYGGVKRYFSKLGENSATWTSLEDSGFKTKVTELKSKFFEHPLEYDVLLKPDLEKFVVQLKSDVGNSNDLTLFPVRNYHVNKVKFGNTELWASNRKEERVVRLKLFLLGYEVHLVQLFVVDNPEGVEPRQKPVYLYKENGVFKTLANKNEYEQRLTRVKAAADRTRPFVYRNDWVATNATLHLTAYNPEEWTVVNENLTTLLLKKTLKPKDGLTFTNLVYLGETVLPNLKRPYVDPLLKNVQVYFKKNLVQLVHVNGTNTVNNSDNTSVSAEFDLYLKKDRDELLTLTKEQFDKYVELLKGTPDYFVDNFVHLDLGDVYFNTNFFTVTNEYEDGVVKKVVTANGVKVSKLTHNNYEFFKQTHEYKDKYVTHFELYTVGDAQLLKVHFNTVASRVLSRVDFEKRDRYTEWADFNNRTFNEALNTYKGVTNWQDVELNVGSKPLPDLFNVVVNPLKGNRTEVVLKPLWQKKLTKVKYGDVVLWEAGTNNPKRVFAVYLYLEAYEPKFVVLDVVTDGRFDTSTNTKVKKLRDTGAFADDSAFDTKLNTFKTQDNSVAFTYNSNWVLPPKEFDPAKFNANDFEVTATVEELVQTKKFVPKRGTVVNKVTLDGSKVWPVEEGENTTKKLDYLEVLYKDNLVQLLKLRNVLVAPEGTPEELHFKKVMGTFVKVELNDFTELKKTLAKADTYVDNNVKLDLSGEVSTDLFKKESTLEDGVEKEVVELKVGKLYEVKASPPLWTSTDGSYVTKLERYTLETSQMLVLYVTDKSGVVTKQYYEKALTPAVPAEVPREQAAGGAQQGTSGQESGTGPTVPAPEKPSFTAMSNKTVFFEKLNKAKESVQHEEVTLNLNAYKDENKFRVLESDQGKAKLYKLFPLANYWVTQLNNGDNKLWEKKDEAYKMVEAWVYLHDGKVKFVKTVVWPKNRVDEENDKQMFYKLNLSTNKYEDVSSEEFYKVLREETNAEPTPLPLSTGGMLGTKTREYRKLFLTENVDTLLFENRNEKRGEYTLRSLTPKANVFVNLLETRHGVLWKAEQTTHLWKGATFAFKDNTGHVDLTFDDNSVENHKYFNFEANKWREVNKTKYDELNVKVPAAAGAAESAQAAASSADPSPQSPPAAPSGDGVSQAAAVVSQPVSEAPALTTPTSSAS